MEYSVVMAIYKNDNPSFLDKSLKSLMSQSKMPSEIIIIKDGYITKELQNIIDNYACDNIKQIQLKHNVGLGKALNEGIKAATNELIGRMDADDISMETRFEKQVREFEINPELDIVGCQVTEFKDEITHIVGARTVPINNEDIYKFARKRDPFNHPSVMYRKSKVLSCGGYADLRKNQDTDLWIRMLRSNAKCKNLEESLVYFRFDENTFVKRKSWINTKSLISIRYKAYKNKFSSLFEFLQIVITQFCIFILPISFQKIIYRKFLRR